MLFTNYGKKYMLDVLRPDGRGVDHCAYRLVPCASTATPDQFTESLDQLTVVNAECGLPIDGWPAIVDPSQVTDDGTVHWWLDWVVKQADPGDVAWLVLINKQRHVLGYMDIRGLFVVSKDRIGSIESRGIHIQPFGDISH